MPLVREMINKSSKAKTAFLVVFLVAPIIYLVRTSTSGPAISSTSVYYTTDEGETTFEGPNNLIPPFEHAGKTASRVWMFTTDGGKTKFVGYLERYTAEAKARLESQQSDVSDRTKASPRVQLSDMEVKKPGQGNPWVNKADIIAAGKAMTFPVPTGGNVDVALP